ncbi:hypothetical protein CRUP_002765 [Coryphaenoides rupestris]|nr:hypothetical protein CRUP_002765 [Coryphaenoides rupestris]
MSPGYGNSTRQYKVRLGDYHALVPEEQEEEYAVERIVLHPAYRPHGNDHDLALVRLAPRRHREGAGPGEECVLPGRHVRPACLPGAKERVIKHAANCYITGERPDRRVDSCRGDSGGPLVCERRGGGGGGGAGGGAGAWVVYGVTSWGHACRAQQSPGVYTKVSAFTPWILKVIGQDTKNERKKKKKKRL